MFDFIGRCLWLVTTLSSIFYLYPSKVFDGFSSQEKTTDIQKAYDFIIIGGGTAGSIVANRLSEDPLTSVLLLEAGGEEPLEAQIPAIAPYLQLTELDWQYKSAPSSTSCLAMVNNRCNLPRGKVLGGSSSINFMLYVRGNQRDFDLWHDLGNRGWSFKDVLFYFKKSEDNKNTIYSQESTFHGVGGYQKVKEPAWKTPLADAFLEAGKELGYAILDVNGPKQVGFMFPQGYYDKGSRHSSSRSFLEPIRDRTNLQIKLHSLVTDVIFNKYKRATAVIFQNNDNNYTVLTTKEIILCAGAFGTPHLLMLSGIGPASHLHHFNITSLVDLPVGRNLQDHIAGALSFVIDKPLSLKRSRYESAASVYQYVVWNSGPLSTLGGVEGIAFVNTKYSNKSLNWPDIQFHFISGSYASDQGDYLRHAINLRESYWEEYLKVLSDVETFTLIVKLMRPRSKGFLELTSNDPRHMPKIVTNYLTEPYDMLVLTDGLKIARKLGESKAFQKFGSKMFSKPIPGCEKLRVRSDKYWECFLRHMTFTIYHYCGTAKMGPYWDPEAVVDSQLRVYGTAGLRVVDASIFPTIPTGNTNAAVMMVAEKASDMIKFYWEEFQRTQDADLKNISSYNESSKTSTNLSTLQHSIAKRYVDVQKSFINQLSASKSEPSDSGSIKGILKMKSRILDIIRQKKNISMPQILVPSISNFKLKNFINNFSTITSNKTHNLIEKNQKNVNKGKKFNHNFFSALQPSGKIYKEHFSSQKIMKQKSRLTTNDTKFLFNTKSVLEQKYVYRNSNKTSADDVNSAILITLQSQNVTQDLFGNRYVIRNEEHEDL